MNLNLQGKVVLVTGGARGIGKAIALTFAQEGAHVVVADIDAQQAQATASEAESRGVQALGVRADVTDHGEVKQMVRDALARFGRLDVLVNNAGMLYVAGRPTTRKLFQEFGEDEDYFPELRVTLHGTLECTRAALPPMLRQRSGSIVNIVSEAGRSGATKGSTIYAAGKGGIIAFSRSLAFEVAESGIRVNCVAPALIRTTRAERAESGLERDPEVVNYFRSMDEIIARTPAGRIGAPQEIADAAVFLASDVSSYITGQTLSVNGGLSMY
jgi:3-oxoacyl-[acyl-carrier protein] reductase